MNNEYDVSKDYYRILNVPDNCSLDDLKRSHVAAAMKYHPDTHASNSSPQNIENFRLISEAWQTLSKPHLRLSYDQARKGTYSSSLDASRIYTGSGSVSNFDDLNASIVNTQKENFANVKINSATNWRDLKDKYKTEKWQNLPLHERKLSRARPIQSVPTSLFKISLPIVATLLFGYGIFTVAAKK